ncbi:MAG: hypothetical protein QM638_03005 [Nocardioides sp.]|uniref:hypothetical protein n=1 Tax=Nocardioides sp. TaxID=35761 RepID=UPI0039E2F2A0
MVGPFILTSAALAEAAALVEASDYPDGLPVSVVVSSPAAITPTLEAVADPRLHLEALEVKLSSESTIVEQIEQIATTTPSGVPTYVEMPRPGHPEWLHGLRAVAEGGLHLKFRTGGTEAEAFPTEDELSTWIKDAVSRDIAFKCTAGLHNAVRHTAASTGFEHHGYLNILLAALEARQGADLERLSTTLAERDGARLADALRAAGHRDVIAARATFLSYGSCSIHEPLDDLAALNLLDNRIWENA